MNNCWNNENAGVTEITKSKGGSRVRFTSHTVYLFRRIFKKVNSRVTGIERKILVVGEGNQAVGLK